MAEGLRVWNAAGQVTFDSINATGGIVYGSYEVNPGQSLQIHATEHTSRNARVMSWPRLTTTTVTTSGGYPLISIQTPSTYIKPMLFVVFIY